MFNILKGLGFMILIIAVLTVVLLLMVFPGLLVDYTGNKDWLWMYMLHFLAGCYVLGDEL